MSMGYMPKKVKYAKRQQRMRKKYQNFSCKTCRRQNLCSHRSRTTPHYGAIVMCIEFCPLWKAQKKEKNSTSHTDTKKRKSFKNILKNIF